MRQRRLVVMCAIAAMLVAAFPASAAETTTRLFMRNDSTTCPGNPFLSLEAGVGEPGCGYQYGLPYRELNANGAPVAAAVKRYPTVEDVSALTMDADRDGALNVRVVQGSATQRMGAGQIRVDVSVEGITTSGATVALGSVTATRNIDPTSAIEQDFPFALPLADALDNQVLTSVTAVVDIRGLHVGSGYHRLNGTSWLDLPTITPDVLP